MTQTDQSDLDIKYFIDKDKYNCPFCNRHSVTYSVIDSFGIDWSDNRKVYGYLVICGGDTCKKVSLHLSDYYFGLYSQKFWNTPTKKEVEVKTFMPENLDDYFFYHQPTTFFTLNSLIPEPIRNLVAEAEGCKKMNYMVGASGALRKAKYEFLKEQEAKGKKYQNKIKWLKKKHKNIDNTYFDALANIQNVTSTNLHEKESSWQPWTIKEFDYVLEAVKSVLEEVYATPIKRKGRLTKVLELKTKSLNKEFNS